MLVWGLQTRSRRYFTTPSTQVFHDTLIGGAFLWVHTPLKTSSNDLIQMSVSDVTACNELVA